jgi:N-acetylmuramoyl-L-alanine amidase
MAKKITPTRAAVSGSERPELHDSVRKFVSSPNAAMSDNAQLSGQASPEPGRASEQPAVHGWIATLNARRLPANSKFRWRALVLVVVLFAAWLVKLPAQSADTEKQLRVFAPQTTYVVPIVEHNGVQYVGLFEVLEPLGRVESHADQRKWRLKFTAAASHPIEVEFTQGEAGGKLAGSGYGLPAEFVLLGGRGFVPVTALGGLLPRILVQMVQLHPGNRLLIGPLGFSFRQQIRQNGLVLTFPSAVNPMIATEPGRIRLTFTREPVIGPVDGGAQTFSDPVFQSSGVAASNGALQLTVNVAKPVIANFSDGNKTITLSPLPAPGTAEVKSPQQQSAPPPASPAQPAATTAPSVSPPSAPARRVVVIDAAHGGNDRGAILAGNVPEKDLTLSLARLIEHDLEAQGVATRMVRTGDTDLDFDQRAATANSAHILAYIVIHAASEGRGVRLYTALLPASAKPPTHKQFVAWDKAQASWLDVSGSLAGSVAAELNQRKIVVRALASPLRPLNNIWAPAFALEVTPPAEEDVRSGAYLHTISAAVSAGIVAVRAKLEVAR